MQQGGCCIQKEFVRQNVRRLHTVETLEIERKEVTKSPADWLLGSASKEHTRQLKPNGRICKGIAALRHTRVGLNSISDLSTDAANHAIFGPSAFYRAGMPSQAAY